MASETTANTATRPDGAGAWRLIPAILAAYVTYWFFGFVDPVAHGHIPEYVVPWVPELGINFAFRLDGLSLAFGLLISGIGAMVFLYAATYFRNDKRLLSLLITLCVFAISMLGLTAADDAITLFVFWEGTTITSFLLVGFDYKRDKSRAAALQALVVTGGGGLALLAGLLILGNITGTYRLSEMNAMGDMIKAHDLYVAVFVLVIIGCFAKSAQWPFHFWLPGAMAAPTPVSAYLHSATMVKAGVYLMARLMPALGGTDLWIWTLTLTGAFTMILASVWAMRQKDLKLMLAFTTVMGLSMITMLLGTSSSEGVLAAMTFLLIHAFYKAALFLSVGMIEKGSGSRDYPEIGGLAHAMPLTASIVAVAALSMAGFPPLFGFIGKELIYESVGHSQFMPAFVAVAAILANALMVACSGMIAIRPFYFQAQKAPKARPADPPWGLWLGPVILAGLGLFCGLVPSVIEHDLIAPMVLAVDGHAPHAHLALWHGFSTALMLSIITFALGFLLYALLDRISSGLAHLEDDVPRTEAWYDGFLNAIGVIARRGSILVQDGNMTTYLRRTFVVMGAVIWLGLLSGTASWPHLTVSIELVDWVIFGMIVVAIGVVLRTPSRLTAITALGAIGSGIAMLFVVYGAPDVAMTQLFVEILVVVFIAIAMVRLPLVGKVPFSIRNALVAGFLGLGVTGTSLMVLGTDLDMLLTDYFTHNSYPLALGRNVVNVILVDFRGFDTMGETAVIVFASVAAYAVLKAGRKAFK